MTKTYDIKVPRSNYLQILAFLVILTSYLIVKLSRSSDSFMFHLIVWFMISLIVIIIIFKLYLIVRFSKEVVITPDSIKTENIEVAIKDIEKIIVQGYFVQSIGIKRVGKKFVSSYLHFRFKYDEEKQVKEWTEWAEHNGIPVVQGRIVKWL